MNSTVSPIRYLECRTCGAAFVKNASRHYFCSNHCRNVNRDDKRKARIKQLEAENEQLRAKLVLKGMK